MLNLAKVPWSDIAAVACPPVYSGMVEGRPADACSTDPRKLQASIMQHMDVDAVKKNGELAAGLAFMYSQGIA